MQGQRAEERRQGMSRISMRDVKFTKNQENVLELTTNKSKKYEKMRDGIKDSRTTQCLSVSCLPFQLCGTHENAWDLPRSHGTEGH